MTWPQRFFFSLLLIPSLICALNEKQSKNIYYEALSYWNQSTELVEQLNGLDPNQPKLFIQLLDDAINCCEHVTIKCDTILGDIAGQSKAKRQKKWRKNLKKANNDLKNACYPRLDNLKGIRTETISSQEAQAFYEQCVQKASQAKNYDFSRNLNNIDEVITNLEIIANLYNEAAILAHKANDITPYSQDKAFYQQLASDFEKEATGHKKEATEWPATILAQKTILKEQVQALKEESQRLEARGERQNSYMMQKQIVQILQKLIEADPDIEIELFHKDLKNINRHITAFEAEEARSRPTHKAPHPPEEDFQAREHKRRELFFKSDFLLTPDQFIQTIMHSEMYPAVFPLDEQVSSTGKNFTLYTEQFYRFLVHSNAPVSELLVTVYENDDVVHEEAITIPYKNTLAWDRYLREGLLFIPETTLKAEFGLDLRLSFVCDSQCNFSMIIAQKGMDSRYRFSISLQETPLYECTLSEPPPWQLSTLRKPTTIHAERSIEKTAFSLLLHEQSTNTAQLNTTQFPILDQFVEELQRNPLALAQYVQNEIAFVDPFLWQEKEIFQAPGIHRNPCMTYLEEQGSPGEQCQLLVYLLRKAGYQARYATGDPCILPKTLAEKMLLKQLPETQPEALVNYPWVLFFDGKEWISLFPWIKEVQIDEGYDLYNFMPDEYASADRWISRYLQGDENILKHIGSDGNDTTGLLFSRFVEEQLREQGMSLSDVGICRTPIKREFTSWEDFPRPIVKKDPQNFYLSDTVPNTFSSIKIKISSHENP